MSKGLPAAEQQRDQRQRQLVRPIDAGERVGVEYEEIEPTPCKPHRNDNESDARSF